VMDANKKMNAANPFFSCNVSSALDT